MTTNKLKPRFDATSWSNLAQIGSSRAISGLSEMVNQEMTVTAFSLEEVSLENATSLIGQADDLVVGIYLLFTGNATGHLMLAFQPEIAFGLVDMAMDLPSGSTQDLGEMERSVLGEMGNIVGSFFLNAVADGAGISLIPSPPAVVMDMAGAIIGSVMAEAWEECESLTGIRLVFSTPARQIEGRFLVLPNFDTQETSG